MKLRRTTTPRAGRQPARPGPSPLPPFREGAARCVREPRRPGRKPDGEPERQAEGPRERGSAGDVAAVELHDAAGRGHDPLLPGMERAAGGAHLDGKVPLVREAGTERVAAGTGGRDLRPPRATPSSPGTAPGPRSACRLSDAPDPVPEPRLQPSSTPARCSRREITPGAARRAGPFTLTDSRPDLDAHGASWGRRVLRALVSRPQMGRQDRCGPMQVGHPRPGDAPSPGIFAALIRPNRRSPERTQFRSVERPGWGSPERLAPARTIVY